MPQAPKADPPKCDLDGCGSPASMMTDGTEKDGHVRLVGKDDNGKYENLNRKPVPFLNVCDHHSNWPFSDDAKAFTTDKDTGPKYAARVAASKGK